MLTPYNKARNVSSGAAGAGAASLQNAPFATPKHHATEGRNDLQKTCCPEAWRPFWILLDSVKNKAIAAAGPAAAAAAPAAARGDAASLQNVPLTTPKHHATEGRNDL